MRDLRPGNRSRLHMHAEGAASQRRILAEFGRSAPIAAAHLWIAPVAARCRSPPAATTKAAPRNVPVDQPRF
jgi:hypothetical protein